MDKPMILTAMLFMHVIADYTLQGVLASMKEKAYWKGHGNYRSKYDFIPALLAHAFSWAFCIMLPLAVAEYPPGTVFYVVLAANTAVHAVVDHAKANLGVLNLVEDQTIHMVQIVLTLLVLAL